jgi:general secretion pathway protein G
MMETDMKNSGFTLIEVMVVVVILAILAAIVVPRIMNRPDQAKVVKAKEDIMAIENAMDLYKLDNGFYPSGEQGIQALVSKPTSSPTPTNWENGGYLKRLPIDPWGHAYHFANPGSHGDIDIFTYGAGNQPDGQGMNATIGNWNISDKKSS